MAGYSFLSLCTLTTACQHPPEPTITNLTITRETLHFNIKPLGINLSGQTFYDSAQMLRNLTVRNPGFEGETWQSILHCKSAQTNTCTDENQYTVWPANFLADAHYENITSGTSGKVVAQTPADGTKGVTLTLQTPTKPGDFLILQAEKPGTAEAGWWPSLTGGATLATEFHDLSPHSPGKQALRLNAAAPGQTAAVSSYFDSMQGHSFVQLSGHFTLTFRAKQAKENSVPHPSRTLGWVGGPQTSTSPLTVKLERLDTTHGVQNFLSHNVALTNTWQDYTFNFNAKEDGSAVGTIGLTFITVGATILLDDVALTADADAANPTAFRNEVVQTLRDLRPGVLRYMDNGANFGSSLDNLLAPQFARQRTGHSTQGTLQEDIPIGLHDFLTLCQAVGAEPWFSMPPVISPAEAANLIEYLSGSPTTPYGRRRAALGQIKPWSEVFSTIHLELGNEQWNHQSFAGATINDPTAYGRRATQIYAAMRSAPAFRAGRYDLILGSWATVPWWTQQELAAASGIDSVAVAPYLFNDFNEATSTEAIFGPMFAQPESIDSRPTGYMAQTAALLKSRAPSIHSGMGGSATNPPGPNLAVYEVNLGSMTGSAAITQRNIDDTVPSLGAGLAVIDHMLLMLRDLGVTTQCLFALPEYLNNFSAPGPKRMIPLWGAVVDMGGPTNLRRPQFLSEQLANRAILPTELATHLTGPAHTWNQPESPNDKIRLEEAHALQTFAFADGTRHSLILLNLSRTESIPIQFAGPIKPAGQVEQSRLTSAKITDTNESAPTISIQTTHLTAFNPATPYQLPPFSMTVLAWHQR